MENKRVFFKNALSNNLKLNVSVHTDSVLLMPLAETIKGLVSFILKDVDLTDHTSILQHESLEMFWTRCLVPLMKDLDRVRPVVIRETLRKSLL